MELKQLLHMKEQMVERGNCKEVHRCNLMIKMKKDWIIKRYKWRTLSMQTRYI